MPCGSVVVGDQRSDFPTPAFMTRPIKITTRESMLSSVGFFDQGRRWRDEDRDED
jgi:hypothetical protein